MGSTSKCRKLHKEQNDKQCEDRISNLPSSLIGHILSLLPTKYAVATSVLSTRWKQFWTLVTSLDFDDELRLHPEKRTNNSLRTSFTNFVYRVLLLRRESFLSSFRLNCYQTYEVSHVNAWVAASLVCGVEELVLSIRIKKSTDLVLPRDLFACRTVVVLRLGKNFVMNVPTSVGMQSLKILHLNGVRFRDDDSIYRLISGCPVLDELSMVGCVGRFVKVIHIFAPVLTKFFLQQLAYYYGFETEDATCKIVLDTPALQYLSLDHVEAVEGYLVKSISRLIKVVIRAPVRMEANETVSQAVTELLLGISSVQRLRLHGEFIVVLSNCNYQLPIFHNLTSLKLDRVIYIAWTLMLQLLENSPRLENLTFSDESDPYEGGDDWQWNPPPNVPVCLVSHLKVISIWGLQVEEEELKMLEYFLKNAELLEKVVINSLNYNLEGQVEAQAEAFKKVLSFPRGSKICQIECVIIRGVLRAQQAVHSSPFLRPRVVER